MIALAEYQTSARLVMPSFSDAPDGHQISGLIRVVEIHIKEGDL